MADRESLFVAVTPQEGLFWGLHLYGYDFCERGGGVRSGRISPAAGVRMNRSQAAAG